VTAQVLASPAAEISRLRERLAAALLELEQLRAIMLASDPGPDHWLELYRTASAADRAREYRAGREDMAREYEADWAAIAGPVARGGPAFAELEFRRWGPGGRARFGDPRPGDHLAGPVPTW